MRETRERKRRSAGVGRRFLRISDRPKIKVLQYINNLLSIGNKGNNIHGRAARCTGHGVDFIDEMNEASPGGAAGRRRRCVIDNGGIEVFLLG
jgi:hypothetical protein